MLRVPSARHEKRVTRIFCAMCMGGTWSHLPTCKV